MSVQPLFVTGYLRSGTSLLEKVLHAHPRLCVGAQPFPGLYYFAKEAFHRERGQPCADYPLSHLFRNDTYTRADLAAFLGRRVFTEAELAAAFARMEGYSGWQTPELGALRSRVRPGTFTDVFTQLVGLLPELYGKPAVTHAGSKEVYCEEFVPLLLEHGVKVLLIVRDVRDVVTSMNFGGAAHVGATTPTLYAVRQWRKSVAYALAHEGHPGCLVVRYEDLVAGLAETLGRVTAFLGVEPLASECFADGLRDQRGRPWAGNSSHRAHDTVDTGSVGAHRTVLPAACVRYVESLTFPELRALGYPGAPATLDEGAVRSFREPRPARRAMLPADYSSDPAEVDAEIRRAALLGQELANGEAERWFVYPRAHERLRAAVGSATGLDGSASAAPRASDGAPGAARDPAPAAEAAGDAPSYSVVVPVYNSSGTVTELVERLDAVFREQVRDSYEVILVDDGSQDPRTWPALEALVARHPTVRALQLMRNFGKAGAVLCGFAEARGRYVVTLDDDLQQLPEDLPLLLAAREHDVVIGASRVRHDTQFARLASRLKGWFDRRLLGKPKHVRMAPYKLFKATIVKAMLEIRTPYPFIPALMYYVTRDVVNVEVGHQSRTAGRSGFTVRKKARQFLSLLINNSSFLLEVVAGLGVVMALVSVLLGTMLIGKKLLYGVNVAGWTSLTVLVLMTSGVVLFSLGVIGEYLIRIINGIEARQPYVVRTRRGGRR